ncbi:hypothetical protein [Brevundimonas sp.]|uniref:hypothetical protein n=1 Tax=Brevundimonas sp. TaxID=1871086 RepID=UPI002D72861F|nr:hypothetical protein [Brevundimonas sp.]HYC66656.1 hypothetical protein [Brevundimonas sp.]
MADAEIVEIARAETPDGGVVRLSQWPEGFVLWYHGEIVWRSWREAETVSKLVLKIDASEVQAMVHAEMAKLEQRARRHGTRQRRPA